MSFNGPYPRIDVTDKLEKEIFSKPFANWTLEDAIDLLHKHSITYEKPINIVHALDKLIEHFIEPFCVNPTFLINHPAIMSPLAASHEDVPWKAHRFELFVNGMELVNAYSEVHDAVIQRKLFHAQMQQNNLSSSGTNILNDNEEEYCQVMDYGMPPTAGWGIGLDRLFMLLGNIKNIKKVILFPHLNKREQN